MIDIEHLNNLESSGIIDAYEYVLRKLISEGLPEEKVYEKCATYLLEYEKVHLDKNLKVNGINNYRKFEKQERKEYSLYIYN